MWNLPWHSQEERLRQARVGGPARSFLRDRITGWRDTVWPRDRDIKLGGGVGNRKMEARRVRTCPFEYARAVQLQEKAQSLFSILPVGG